MEALLSELDWQCGIDHQTSSSGHLLRSFQIEEISTLINQTPPGNPASLNPEAVWFSDHDGLSIYTVTVELTYDDRGYRAVYAFDVVKRRWHCWMD